jgi:uncharacterized protein
VRPTAPGLFPVRFENHLGLSELQLFSGSQPMGAPLVVEVLSSKFPTLQAHRQFLSSLLDELFARAARIPFAISAPTSRGILDAAASTSPLFQLHFLRCHATEVESALDIILRRPCRSLESEDEWVHASRAHSLGPDTLLEMAHHPEYWDRAEHGSLSGLLRGRAPRMVWQSQASETMENAENRFAKAAIMEMLQSLSALRSQAWWERVPTAAAATLVSLEATLRAAASSPILASLGPMESLPTRSLRRRDGYRELLSLWSRFSGASQPLFGPLTRAMQLRDIAALYEMWVFFRLVEELGSLFGMPVEGRDLDLQLSDAAGLGWNAAASFGSHGRLVYQQAYTPGAGSSYSLPLRPDFTWMREGRPDVVLDAKFRLDTDGSDSDHDSASDDIHKMHTYRDALGIRAAAVLYPGERSIFYHRSGTIDPGISIASLVRSPVSGVAAIALRPSTHSEV